MRLILSAILALALLTAGPAGGAVKPEITVFAAASLGNEVESIL